MKVRLLSILSVLLALVGRAQNFELVDRQDNYSAGFNQLVKIHLKIKNNSDRAQFYTVRKSRSDLSEAQKGYFCLDNKCLESSVSEFVKKVDPGETVNLNFTVESGNQAVLNNIKFDIFPKNNPTEVIEHIVSLNVDERGQRSIYQSRELVINDVYPNPAQDIAVIDYKIHNELLKAKIVVHNILGRSMGEYELPTDDTRIKMIVDDFAPGVYFYTLYVNNTGVLTRKIMVRK